MEIDFPYELSDDDARSRLELLAQYLTNRHGIGVTWLDGGRAKFHGNVPSGAFAGRSSVR